MPPQKRPVNGNPTASNSEYIRPLDNNIPDPTMQNQFQQMMQAMLDSIVRQMRTRPDCKQVVYRTFYSSCAIKIGEVVLLANLILLEMYDFDIILGMDWFAGYHATMDCFHKTLAFKLEETPVGVLFQGERRNPHSGFISALKAVDF
ncbi:hypothetical protein AAC387_Pa01g2477 [Persea americana]